MSFRTSSLLAIVGFLTANAAHAGRRQSARVDLATESVQRIGGNQVRVRQAISGRLVLDRNRAIVRMSSLADLGEPLLQSGRPRVLADDHLHGEHSFATLISGTPRVYLALHGKYSYRQDGWEHVLNLSIPDLLIGPERQKSPGASVHLFMTRDTVHAVVHYFGPVAAAPAEGLKQLGASVLQPEQHERMLAAIRYAHSHREWSDEQSGFRYSHEPTAEGGYRGTLIKALMPGAENESFYLGDERLLKARIVVR